MSAFITIPGIDSSGTDHWQSRWEASDLAFARFQPTTWDAPRLDDWMDALERAVAGTPGAVLVAHSLGCLLVAHWANRSESEVAGAFLVSVPNPDAPAFPEQASTFRGLPDGFLPFPALVISSSTDPYGSLDYQQSMATRWGAGHIDIGDHGHINEASSLGAWQQGRDLLTAFAVGLHRTTRHER
ncbi:RBBP9/YdeN family alpha/beta hydrolase [Microbacterium yannicii]|uniref:RBBP9/YdeN family alpha/beta hydrolase n=1 Tax=Microbacterium yannicii TaxID=671622 RepID=UPI0003147EA1|nr:alpha/beta hydrolase [Microbacterium yannicii]